MIAPFRYENPDGLGALEVSQTAQGLSVCVSAGPGRALTVCAAVRPEDARDVAAGMSAILLAGEPRMAGGAP
jgi:hypothetical protein